jgi:hypothetical protein
MYITFNIQIELGGCVMCTVEMRKKRIKKCTQESNKSLVNEWLVRNAFFKFTTDFTE